MARPLRIYYPNAFYHVTCRGNERRDIYRDDQDRSLCLEKLKTSLDIYGVRLHAYVLMRNHFHLLVETPKANLSEFMRHFNIAYTGAYNRRHRRVGIPLNSARRSEAIRPAVPGIPAGVGAKRRWSFSLSLSLHGLASLLFYFLFFRIESPLSSIL